MKTSVTARASRHNPQPLPKKSIDTIATPGHISLTKHHTVVRSPGVVEMTNIFSPGSRKLVSSNANGVVLVKGVVELKTMGAWAFLECTGDQWTCLYLGEGALKSKKTSLKEKTDERE